MSMAEQKSIGVFKLLGALDPLSGKKIVFIRAGESVAEVFPDWIEESQLEEGYYLPFDLNIPIMLPKRPNLKAAYKADPPLSEIGTLVSKRVASELCSRFITSFKQMYTSPSLACLQTARAIQHTFAKRDNDCKLRISNNLATDGNAKQHWMKTDNLIMMGYNLDDAYHPDQHISKPLNQENITRNIQRFLEEILADETLDYPVLIVCDSIAMAVMVNQMRGKSFTIPSENAYKKCSKMFPASSTFVCDLDAKDHQLTKFNLRPINSIGLSSIIRYDP